MILILFIIGILFTLFCLFIGYTQNSFGMAYLGMFSMLLMGLFLFSSGLEIESGLAETPPGSGIFTKTYTVYTVENNPIINLLANTMFYVPILGIILTIYLSFKY